MFCPSCGSDERQGSQYCRACGTDLRPVRLSLERPDSITASAATAREEIGRAVAQQIRQVEDTRDLKRVAEDVLPKIEKFLESPEEKRLRRMRAGTIISTIGLGATVGMLMISLVSQGDDRQFFMMTSSLGIICFFIGLGFLLNAFFFTRPVKGVSDRSADAQAQNLLDANYHAPSQLRGQTTSNLVQPPGSVTDNTTLHLKSDR